MYETNLGQKALVCGYRGPIQTAVTIVTRHTNRGAGPQLPLGVTEGTSNSTETVYS